MKDFKWKIKIKAEHEDVWMALTNPASMELWTGYSAVFKPIAGEEFSLWEGDITGKVLKVEEGKEIVEQWYFEGENIESIVRLKVHNQKNNVLVEVFHENIPDEAYDNIIEGWKHYYLGAIKEFTEAGE